MFALAFVLLVGCLEQRFQVFNYFYFLFVPWDFPKGKKR